MANPALNEKTFTPERVRQVDPGFADRVFGQSGPGVAEPADVTSRAERESWRDVMTLDGVIFRGLILAPILLAAGWFGWQSVKTVDGVVTSVPGWLLPALLVGF